MIITFYNYKRIINVRNYKRIIKQIDVTFVYDLFNMKLFWYTMYTLYCGLQQEKLHFLLR